VKANEDNGIRNSWLMANTFLYSVHKHDEVPQLPIETADDATDLEEDGEAQVVFILAGQSKVSENVAMK